MNASPKEQERQCAYCKGPGPFTREHVTPNFLYKRHPDQKFGYNPRADAFLEWEATVRDVCKKCNSGPLSQLDQYGERFYLQNRCSRLFTSWKIVKVSYDYNLLLRWLLKMSFNAVRFKGESSEFLERSVPFILKGLPLSYQSDAFIEIVRDKKIRPEEKQFLSEQYKSLKSIESRWFRLGWILPRFISSHFIGRFVGIQAFYFYVFLFSPDCSIQTRDKVLEICLEEIRQAIRLAPDRQQVSIPVSNRTVLDVYEDQAKKLMPKWLLYQATLQPKKN
jgi:hypothetical protein